MPPLVDRGTEFRLGVAELDTQREQLADALDGLQEALTLRQDQQVFTHRLNKLARSARSHFCIMEALMEEQGHPDLDAHRQQHEALARTVVEFKHRFEAGDCDIPISRLTLLCERLARHVQEMDREFVTTLTPPRPAS